MTEINERLARFAWPDALNISCKDDLWAYNDDTTFYDGIPFTESLDAQVKYLWPKLWQVTIDKNPDLDEDVEHWGCAAQLANGELVSEKIASTPALASAQAIAKLLEGKA